MDGTYCTRSAVIRMPTDRILLLEGVTLMTVMTVLLPVCLTSLAPMGVMTERTRQTEPVKVYQLVGLHLCPSTIQGSVWSDCLYGCCCYTLSWLQISRELKRRAAAHASSSSSSSSSSSAAKYTTLPLLQGSHLV
ncbi:uncharacterized protein LOC133662651 isoform X2 [Entelurus aequoreus]|nr:uncharacterized protein LOC133662651 isoform X2 [Entelurus aequoreus]